MKIARTTEGKEIIATAGAPERAVCPYCGGVLVLRGRRTMNKGEYAYYWRHLNNNNRHCSGRKRLNA